MSTQESQQMSMPQVTFSTFILSMSSSALVQLGEVPDPASGAKHQDKLMAKHSIDLLDMLKEIRQDIRCVLKEEARTVVTDSSPAASGRNALRYPDSCPGPAS